VWWLRDNTIDNRACLEYYKLCFYIVKLFKHQMNCTFPIYNLEAACVNYIKKERCVTTDGSST